LQLLEAAQIAFQLLVVAVGLLAHEHFCMVQRGRAELLARCME
jgi:hypothetical protein